MGFIFRLLSLAYPDEVWLVYILSKRQFLLSWQKSVHFIEIILLLRENVLGVMWVCRVGCLSERDFLDFCLIDILVFRGDYRFLTTLITEELLLSLNHLVREQVCIDGGRTDCNLRVIHFS